MKQVLKMIPHFVDVLVHISKINLDFFVTFEAFYLGNR
jgi:hypothetical protein